MIQLVFARMGFDFGGPDGMPWPHIKKDFENFRARTMNTSMIMGAKTFESLPCLLPGRKHIVVCDMNRVGPMAKDGSRAHQYISKEQFVQLLAQTKINQDRNLSIIGGVDLLETAIDYADQIIETQVKIHPLEQKKTTVFLSREFLDKVDKIKVLEAHFYQVDPTTSITENIRVK